MVTAHRVTATKTSPIPETQGTKAAALKNTSHQSAFFKKVTKAEINALPEKVDHKKKKKLEQLPELSPAQLEQYTKNTVTEAKESFKNRYRNCYDDSILQVSRFFATKSKTHIFAATVEEINTKIERLHSQQQFDGRNLTIKELRRTKDDIGYRSALEIAMDTIANTLETNIAAPNQTAVFRQS